MLGAGEETGQGHQGENSTGIPLLLHKLQADVSSLSDGGGPCPTNGKTEEGGRNRLILGAELSRVRNDLYDAWDFVEPDEQLAGCAGGRNWVIKCASSMCVAGWAETYACG